MNSQIWGWDQVMLKLRLNHFITLVPLALTGSIFHIVHISKWYFEMGRERRVSESRGAIWLADWIKSKVENLGLSSSQKPFLIRFNVQRNSPSLFLLSPSFQRTSPSFANSKKKYFEVYSYNNIVDTYIHMYIQYTISPYCEGGSFLRRDEGGKCHMVDGLEFSSWYWTISKVTRSQLEIWSLILVLTGFRGKQRFESI